MKSVDVNPPMNFPQDKHHVYVYRTEHEEGPIARILEQSTARISSDVFLFSAFGAMGVSLGLSLAGRKYASLFVANWASPLLICGLYNKFVKLNGSH